MNLDYIYKNYKTAPLSMKVNQYKLPKVTLNLDEYQEFNELVFELLELEKKGLIHRGIVRTPSGGISIKKHINLYRGACFDVVAKNNFISLTVLDLRGMFQIVLSNKTNIDEDQGIGGAEAFKRFKEICKKFDVNLDDFAIDNGYEVKQQIPKPRIELTNKAFTNIVITNAHHIDLNTAYMAGIAKAFTELLPPIQYIYDNRKQPGNNGLYKAILNYSYGYMQSVYHQYKHAHLSLEAHRYCHRMLDDISVQLREHGCSIIAYNTDGIWFTGDCDWIVNSNELGKFKVDHKNCKIRFKSAGAYEFIEDGVYYPVIRGKTRLDNIKPRTEWSWGDIYRDDATIVKYEWQGYEKGVVKYE